MYSSEIYENRSKIDMGEKMNTIELYAFGRKVTQDEWYIDRSRIVNRLYFVNSGSATVRIGAKEWVLTEGHFYVLPRSESFVPMAALEFDHTYFDYYSSRILRSDMIFEGALSSLGAAHFLSFVNALLVSDPPPPAMQEIMQLLLQAFLSCADGTFPKNFYIANEVIAGAVDCIHKDFAFVSTKDLAVRAHLSKSYFIRLFRECIGLSPLEYIRARRVLYGEQLLLRGLSVEETAEACGYASVSAFYKAVRAETGQAPSAFRAKNSQ